MNEVEFGSVAWGMVVETDICGKLTKFLVVQNVGHINCINLSSMFPGWMPLYTLVTVVGKMEVGNA